MRIIEIRDNYYNRPELFQDSKLITFDNSFVSSVFLDTCRHIETSMNMIANNIVLTSHDDDHGYSNHIYDSLDEAVSDLSSITDLIESFEADFADDQTKSYKFSISGMSNSVHLIYTVNKKKTNNHKVVLSTKLQQ